MNELYQREFSAPPKIYEELPRLKSAPVIKWLKKEVFAERYLFCNKVTGEAVCSNCGNVDMPQDVKHNSQGVCLKCGAKVQYKSWQKGRKKLEKHARILIFQRKGKSVYATTNFIYANYSKGQVELHKEIDGVFKFNRKEQEGWQTNYSHFYGGCWERQKNIRVPYRTGRWLDVPVYTYTGNIEKVFHGTDLQYCQLAEQAKNLCSELFLKLVDLNAKYESVEKIHKVGLDAIIESKLVGGYGSGAVKWKKAELKDILGITKPEIAQAREQKATMYDLEIYKKMKKIGIKTDFKEAAKMDNRAIRHLYIAEKYNLTPIKVYKYLKKQSENEKTYVGWLIGDYVDYIKECEKLELDLTNKTILLPKKLIAAHARTSAQIEVIANKEEQEKVIQNANRMKYLNFQSGNLLIRVAETAKEIITEGKLMEHCVGGYVGRVAKGSTNIFFVRRLTQPQEPYYTLELERKGTEYRMKQCRGKENCNMTEEVEMFVNKWMEEVVNRRKNRKEVA